MKPLTRKEMLLDGAAKGNLDDFKPATREEVFIKKALDPKYLPVMTVNMTGNEDWTLTCDKTYDEIDAHISAGGIVEAIFYRKTSSYPYYATLANKTSTGFNFYATNWGYAGSGALNNIRMMAMFVCFDSTTSGWAESYLTQTTT